jgi:hypothetical protein
VLPPEGQPACVHPDEERRAQCGGATGLAAAHDPNGQDGLDDADTEQDGLRNPASEPRDRRDDVYLLRTAAEKLAPEAVVEPDTRHRCGCEPPSELALHLTQLFAEGLCEGLHLELFARDVREELVGVEPVAL